MVLLVGGGEGMGPLEPTARAIDAAHLPVQIVIIAGRNKKLKERLQKHHWRTPTTIYGFVQEMPDFMRAADVLVTKAGPGTISEAFIAGLPMIFTAVCPVKRMVMSATWLATERVFGLLAQMRSLRH